MEFEPMVEETPTTIFEFVVTYLSPFIAVYQRPRGPQVITSIKTSANLEGRQAINRHCSSS
mgnify:CR=1 FL=1